MPPRIFTNCQHPGCGNPHYATGLCRPHYIQRRNAITRAATKPIAPMHSQPAPNTASTDARRVGNIIQHPTYIPPAPAPVMPPPVIDYPTENAGRAFAGAWAQAAPVPPAPAPVAVPAAPMLPISVPPPPVPVAPVAKPK